MFQGRKLVTMLLSLLAAVILWLYVVTTVAPEANTRVNSIPVTIDGSIVLEERGLMITDQTISEVSLELSASRVNLSKLNAATIRVSADASKIREPGTYALNCSVTFPDTIRSGDVDILRKSSDTVTITVTRLETKNVPVRLAWTGSVKEGFVFEAEGSILEPDEITLVGPDYEVSKVKEAIVSYDVSNLEQTEITTQKVIFVDEKGEEVELSEYTTVGATEVSLTLPILRTKNITLNVIRNPGGGIGEDNAIVTLTPETILVKGTADVLDKLDDVLDVGTVELSGILDKEEFIFNLALPAGVINVSGDTEVHALVEIVGVTTDTIHVSDIRLANVPEGYYAEAVARTVQVTVRGDKNQIAALKQDKNNGFYILVDLQSYTQTGLFTVAGKVMNDGDVQVGVVDVVEVGISITTEEPQETED